MANPIFNNSPVFQDPVLLTPRKLGVSLWTGPPCRGALGVGSGSVQGFPRCARADPAARVPDMNSQFPDSGSIA